MERKSFIDILASGNPEEINKILEEKGKKKPRAMIILLDQIRKNK